MKINKFIIVLFVFGWLFAQGDLNSQVEGSITYITVENVYIDLGSEDGLGIGDTLPVYRRNDEIGLLVVQSAGRKSSVTNPLVPVSNFQLGDRVIFIPKQRKEVPGKTIQDVETIEKIETPPKKHRKKPLFNHGGSLSFRGNWNKYNGGLKQKRLLGNLNYRLGIDLPLKSQVWIYGHNNFMENSFRLYQMRLEIGDKNTRIYGQAGRLYASELAGVGAVDGVMVSTGKNGKNRVGAMAGFQPEYLRMKFSTDVKKLSVFSTNEWKPNHQVIRFNTALVGQYTKNKIDREFMYIKLYWKTKSNFEFSWYETIDVYRDSTVYERSLIEPLSSQISIRFRLGRVFAFNSRLSSRKQVLYRQSGSMLPDSLFVDELRTGWYNSIQINTFDWGTLRLSSNVRMQANSSELSQVISGGYTAPRLRNNLYIRLSSSFIKNLLITGVRNRISVSKSFNGKGSMFADYDLYVYGFGNQLADYSRHTVSFGMNYRILKKLNTNVSVDLSKDGEFDSIYLYYGITYRL